MSNDLQVPDDPVLLKGIVRELLATHHAQQRQIEQLTHRLDLLLKRAYGPQADTLDPRSTSSSRRRRPSPHRR